MSEEAPWARKSSRVHNTPFDDILLDKLVFTVRNHLVRFVGGESDSPQAIDVDAAALVPGAGPGAANCAAVWIQPDGRPLVAWNSVLTAWANARFGLGLWDHVRDASDIKHAEIKLMESDRAGAALTGMHAPYIGISKPCCLPCAAVMKIEGIGTRGRHSEKNTNWAFPESYKTDMGKMKLFLGDDVHKELVGRAADKSTSEQPYLPYEISLLMSQLAQQL